MVTDPMSSNDDDKNEKLDLSYYLTDIHISNGNLYYMIKIETYDVKLHEIKHQMENFLHHHKITLTNKTLPTGYNSSIGWLENIHPMKVTIKNITDELCLQFKTNLPFELKPSSITHKNKKTRALIVLTRTCDSKKLTH